MIKDLIQQGINLQIEEHNSLEKTKVGTLRGGNTGAILEDGTIIGACPASSFLRFKGISVSPTDESKELMFASGRANEDIWLEQLKKSYDGPILCEEDIPTRWETENGTAVTGRPDIVLLTKDTEQPKCMIELKQIMSVNSAYNRLIKKQPDLKHVLQASHYMWQLGCKGELWYTNRMIFEMPEWMKFREFPKPGTPGSENFDYRYYIKGNINPRTNKPKKHQIKTEEEYQLRRREGAWAEAVKMKPFLQGFELRENSGRIFYKDAMDKSSPWIETIVTFEGIKKYYEMLSTLEGTGKVPRPSANLTVTGEKMNWKFSDYSDLKELDPEYCKGQDLSTWLDKVKDKFNI